MILWYAEPDEPKGGKQKYSLPAKPKGRKDYKRGSKYLCRNKIDFVRKILF